MATDNTVTLIGNLTDDPELRFTTNGATVANFRLAVTPASARATSGPTERPASSASTAGDSSPSTSPRPSAKAPGPSSSVDSGFGPGRPTGRAPQHH
jgi:Single-strand binding protein family